eukprot:447243-Pyramimonas_sp.AAC.1
MKTIGNIGEHRSGFRNPLIVNRGANTTNASIGRDTHPEGRDTQMNVRTTIGMTVWPLSHFNLYMKCTSGVHFTMSPRVVNRVTQTHPYVDRGLRIWTEAFDRSNAGNYGVAEEHRRNEPDYRRVKILDSATTPLCGTIGDNCQLTTDNCRFMVGPCRRCSSASKCATCPQMTTARARTTTA